MASMEACGRCSRRVGIVLVCTLLVHGISSRPFDLQN
jgi:hypothetical protein